MVFIQAAVMGLAGGLVTVLFFSYWPATFGRRQLGSIQGAAQFLTVVASAAGPLVLARIQEASGSYALAFRILALVTAALGLAAVFVRPPRKPSACTSPVTAGCR
jgi:MFS family permease